MVAALVPLPLRHAGASTSSSLPRPARSCRPALRRQRLCVAAGMSTAAPAEPQVSSKAPKYATVDLPILAKDFVPAEAKLPDAAFGADRKADAIVLEPQGVQKGEEVYAVIFCHGFSQGPQNYLSTLEKFTEQGWLVIAPTTSILDIAFSPIETVPKGKAPAKLQTALILDTLRSAQYLYRVQKDYKIKEVLLCGHSMGGAGALVATSKLQKMVKGVGVMAPAVKQTVKTEVNPGLAMGNKQGQAAAIDFFKDDFPDQAPLHILAGKEDFIVGKKEVQGLYDAAYAGNVTALPYGDLKLYWMRGSHIGFEDNVNLEFNAFLLQKLLFLVINFLLYKLEVTKLLTGDFSEQRQLSQQLLVNAFKAAIAGAGMDDEVTRGIEDVSVAKKPSKEEIKQLEEGASDKPEDAPWVLQTLLLLSYAACHAFSFSHSLELLKDYGSELSSFSAAGLAVVTVIAAGLVYENVVLAAGRFITDNGTKNLALLDALNDPRFLFHSAAPLLSIAGLDMAQRLGVGWASNTWVQAGVVLACAVVVSLSTIRNTLLLQTKPTWSGGIFHYTFDDNGFDFTRIIPVAATTVLLTALGVSATINDVSNWPFAAGPAICLALSAGVIPRSVAPMIITGNAGEALLLLSLMLTEASLLGVKVL